MRDNIYFSSSIFKERDLSKLLQTCMDNGITNLELGSNVKYGDNNLDLVFSYKGKKMNFLIHNYFPPPHPQKSFVLNLALDNCETARNSMELCKHAIDISALLKAPFYSVHSGFAFYALPQDLGRKQVDLPMIPYEKAYRTFINNISKLTEYAAKKGVMLAVENNVVAEFNLIKGKNKLLLLADHKESLDFIKSISSRNIFFLIDLGHLKVTSHSLGFDINSYLDALLPYTIAFHLSENNSRVDEHMSFEKNVWFRDLVKKESKKIFVIESQNLTISQMQHSYFCLKNMLN